MSYYINSKAYHKAHDKYVIYTKIQIMKSVTLIISGSIAAIKAPELIRQLRAKKIAVHCIVTKGGSEFVSLKEIREISGNPVSTDLFSLKEKKAIWHIRFSRETDLMIVAPASADLIAKMAHGIADDMASATLLANNKRLVVAPAMNTQMWIHPATQRNIKQLVQDGAIIIEPREGMLACGEVGQGRMAEPAEIVAAILTSLRGANATKQSSNVKQLDCFASLAMTDRLKGKKALVTSGPTHEPIDPVRYIANRSSGKQGHAIATALACAGAAVTLVSGPTNLPDPIGVKTVHVTTAKEMFDAVNKALPTDVAVFAAAVGDWRVTPAKQKIKKRDGALPELRFEENPDILRHVANHKTKRPTLVIGFAAETQRLSGNAAKKHKDKGANWVLANDVSGGQVFGKDKNKVNFITGKSKEQWPLMSKDDVAEKLVEKIIMSLRGA